MNSYDLDKTRQLAQFLADPDRDEAETDVEQLIREGADPDGGAPPPLANGKPGPFLPALALACVTCPDERELHDLLLRSRAHIEHARLRLDEAVEALTGRPSQKAVLASATRGQRAMQRAVERLAGRTQSFLAGDAVTVLGELVAAPWNDRRIEIAQRRQQLIDANTGPSRSEADANAASRRRTQDAAPPHKSAG